MNVSATIAFVGDLMLGRKISRALPARGPEWFWGDVLPVLKGADAVIANLESPVMSGRHDRNAWKTFHFRADPAAVEILKCANVRFVSLANNHALDFGASGLRHSLDVLDGAGIAHAGAGIAREQAQAPVTLRVGPLNIGIIAATDNMRTFAAGETRAGVNFIGTMTGKRRALEWIAASVAALRKSGADLVVLALHWGPNMRTRPPSWFRAFARAAIDRGVDILHGHSAHVVQGIERYRDGLILYDTGNFIDDYWKFPFRKTHWSFVFLLDVGAAKAMRLRLIPVHVHTPDHRSPVQRATGSAAMAICARMRMLCGELGTQVVQTVDGLEVGFAAPTLEPVAAIPALEPAQ